MVHDENRNLKCPQVLCPVTQLMQYCRYMLAVVRTSFYGDTIVGDNEMLSKNNPHTTDDRLCKETKIPPTLGGSTNEIGFIR